MERDRRAKSVSSPRPKKRSPKVSACKPLAERLLGNKRGSIMQVERNLAFVSLLFSRLFKQLGVEFDTKKDPHCQIKDKQLGEVIESSVLLEEHRGLLYEKAGDIVKLVTSISSERAEAQLSDCVKSQRLFSLQRICQLWASDSEIGQAERESFMAAAEAYTAPAQQLKAEDDQDKRNNQERPSQIGKVPGWDDVQQAIDKAPNKDTRARVVMLLYAAQPPRRIEDYELMRCISTSLADFDESYHYTDPQMRQICCEPDFNYFLFDEQASKGVFIFQEYKTKVIYGVQQYWAKTQELYDALMEHMAKHGLLHQKAPFEFLLGLNHGTKQPSNLSHYVTTVFTKLGIETDVTCLGRSFVTWWLQNSRSLANKTDWT